MSSVSSSRNSPSASGTRSAEKKHSRGSQNASAGTCSSGAATLTSPCSPSTYTPGLSSRCDGNTAKSCSWNVRRTTGGSSRNESSSAASAGASYSERSRESSALPGTAASALLPMVVDGYDYHVTHEQAHLQVAFATGVFVCVSVSHTLRRTCRLVARWREGRVAKVVFASDGRPLRLLRLRAGLIGQLGNHIA